MVFKWKDDHTPLVLDITKDLSAFGTENMNT
jgi:hypothetical protein